MCFQRFVVLACMSLGVMSCSGHDEAKPPSSLDSPGDPSMALPREIAIRYPSAFHAHIDYDPMSADTLGLLDASSLALNDGEKRILGEKGFVISDRQRFPTFLMAYAEVYRNDLPVYVSADSILHALHKSYDGMLQEVETTLLLPLLRKVLTQTHGRLRARYARGTPAAQVDVYLSVARSLLDESVVRPVVGANRARVRSLFNHVMAHEGATSVDIFGTKRDVDFTQFTPRGHYEHSDALKRYFRTMMWLSRIDFRLLDTTCEGERIVQRPQLQAAMLLASLMRGQPRTHWNEFESVVHAFLGQGDHLALEDLDALSKRLTPIDKHSDEDIASILGDFDEQKIMGHLFHKCEDTTEPLPLPVSFSLFPQRYTPDSHAFTDVTYDRIPKKRDLPDPLDVAFAVFGNNQAAELLQPELDRWEYATELLHARDSMPSRRSEGFYQDWLDAVSALSINEESCLEQLPSIFATEAWGRRLLNTQLASWAELRRDTILYAKPSYGTISCKYPDAYVDPYPEFFDAMGQLAQRGTELASVLQSVARHLRGPSNHNVHTPADVALLEGGLASRVDDYFRNLAETVAILGEMARTQREGRPFSPDQLAFVNRAVSATSICGGFTIDGWYAQLFFHSDAATEFEPTIADVHTNPNTGQVLHVATGAPRLMTVAVQVGDAVQAYIGPVSSYFEKVATDGSRWDDVRWAKEIALEQRGDVPWMQDLVVASPDGEPAQAAQRDWRQVFMLDPNLRR